MKAFLLGLIASLLASSALAQTGGGPVTAPYSPGAVAVTGGTINNTTVGQTTPAALSATSGYFCGVGVNTATNYECIRILPFGGVNYIQPVAGGTGVARPIYLDGSDGLTIAGLGAGGGSYLCSTGGVITAAAAGCTTIPAAPITGTTSAIGGSLLTAGQCVAGTATVTGATTAMVAAVSPSADPDSVLSTGIAIYGFVSSANTATVRICAIVAVTPASTTYNVRVLQ